MNIQKVGGQIAALRKAKGLTQNDLGERLGVTFQSVSKLERGETLPDTAILVDLADVLETTVDFNRRKTCPAIPREDCPGRHDGRPAVPGEHGAAVGKGESDLPLRRQRDQRGNP